MNLFISRTAKQNFTEKNPISIAAAEKLFTVAQSKLVFII